MLFNSYSFIFLFLPITLAGFFLAGQYNRRLAAAWLTTCSIAFYGWWNPIYIGLLLVSIGFNYSVGLMLLWQANQRNVRWRLWIVVFAIAVDLALLGYYKYADFFLKNVNGFLDTDLQFAKIVLPLGISFFTFTQIAFVVDVYRGIAKEPSLLHYTLFVTYFPHLIAGPILHHAEMMPQFAERSTYRYSHECMAVGMTIFAFGLFKKVVFADELAPYATPVFDAAAQGRSLTMVESWGGALAYTLQLYFDFSGYADMAVGLSKMVGVKLPLNFDSPYKAVNIIDYWRRWHMTLSRFLRDYLYIPLGGNRKGTVRRYINLMATMLLGGLWHGANWTFVAWGALHGLLLVINHAWHTFRNAIGQDPGKTSRIGQLSAQSLTFSCVVISWVLFRSDTIDGAWVMLKAMLGQNGVMLQGDWGWHWQLLSTFNEMPGSLFKGSEELKWLAGGLFVVWCCPNTQEIMHRWKPAIEPAGAPLVIHRSPVLAWQPTWTWSFISGVVFVWGLINLSRGSEFLYFQF